MFPPMVPGWEESWLRVRVQVFLVILIIILAVSMGFLFLYFLQNLKISQISIHLINNEASTTKSNINKEPPPMNLGVMLIYVYRFGEIHKILSNDETQSLL